MSLVTKETRRLKRRRRVRAKISGTAVRPRISVRRTNRGIFAQVIDDLAGHTIASVSWTEAEFKGLQATEQAKAQGKVLAERVKAAGIDAAVFDRGGYKFHGRVQAFAEGVREGGLTV
jgi:large subunit ribosomal protein L18